MLLGLITDYTERNARVDVTYYHSYRLHIMHTLLLPAIVVSMTLFLSHQVEICPSMLFRHRVLPALLPQHLEQGIRSHLYFVVLLFVPHH